MTRLGEPAMIGDVLVANPVLARVGESAPLNYGLGWSSFLKKFWVTARNCPGWSRNE